MATLTDTVARNSNDIQTLQSEDAPDFDTKYNFVLDSMIGSELPVVKKRRHSHDSFTFGQSLFGKNAVLSTTSDFDRLGPVLVGVNTSGNDIELNPTVSGGSYTSRRFFTPASKSGTQSTSWLDVTWSASSGATTGIEAQVIRTDTGAILISGTGRLYLSGLAYDGDIKVKFNLTSNETGTTPTLTAFTVWWIPSLLGNRREAWQTL